jgi:hypothetical protein
MLAIMKRGSAVLLVISQVTYCTNSVWSPVVCNVFAKCYAHR